MRLSSIDLLRGIVMVIMALDHVRDFVGIDFNWADTTDLAKTYPALFFTRWITHFCAPVFFFLTGASAFLAGEKMQDNKSLARLLFTRGLWLAIMEFTIITVAWKFSFAFQPFELRVIWALGASMMVLAGLVLLPRAILFVIGVVIVAGHNLLDTTTTLGNQTLDKIWTVLHISFKSVELFGLKFFVLYAALPWIGVMILGYCFGSLYRASVEPEQRKRKLKQIGFATILFFCLLRFSNWYGDASQWSSQASLTFTILSFVNSTKYPPSLLFLCMTLGPAILFLAYAEGKPRWLAKKFIVIGRVPFFYYILHIFLIHAIAVISSIAMGYSWKSFLFTPNWKPELLDGFGFNLWIVYAIWVGVVLSLYPLCNWYNNYKSAHPENYLLKYL